MSEQISVPCLVAEPDHGEPIRFCDDGEPVLSDPAEGWIAIGLGPRRRRISDRTKILSGWQHGAGQSGLYFASAAPGAAIPAFPSLWDLRRRAKSITFTHGQPRHPGALSPW